MANLTGQRRHRIQYRWFRAPIFVLQVEEKKPSNFDPEHDIEPRGYVHIWRDATWEDMDL